MTKRESPDASINRKYGKLLVLELTGNSNKHGEKFVKCICDCGKTKICLLRLIRRGSIQSCGCIKQFAASNNIRKAHQTLTAKGIWKDPILRTQQSVYKKYSDGDISFEQFLIISQMNCFYCDKQPSNRCTTYSRAHGISEIRITNSYFTYNGLDRIDNSIGHTINNVVPCCVYCNTAKLDRTQSEFLDWIKSVYHHSI